MPERLQRAFSDPTPEQMLLCTKLRQLVQYDRLIYMGVCGGALLFGDKYWGGSHIKGFDFLEGISLQYDANVSAAKVECITGQNTIHMTTGCGIAIALKDGQYSCSCFPTVKNSSQWWDFAQTNKSRLSELIGRQMRFGLEWQRLEPNEEGNQVPIMYLIVN